MVRVRRRQGRWHSLADKVWAMPNLHAAWKKVKANRGAAGPDGETLTDFAEDLWENLRRLHEELKAGSYRPKPVRRVYIPKADGKQRPLGIPAVRDRVVQQAVVNILEPIFEPKFADCSFGFRPGRNAHQAIRRVAGWLKAGWQWVVDIDLKGFFDTVDHDVMMAAVSREIADGTVLGWVKAFLTAGVMEEGRLTHAVTGTPQGGVISPLLANIYLNHFDQEMERRGCKLVRYADDLVLVARLERKAEHWLAVARQVLEKDLKLTINEEKTKLAHAHWEGFCFLGHAHDHGYWKPREKAITAFKDRIRELTGRQRGVSLTRMLRELAPVLRGWGNYFRLGAVKQMYQVLDRWVRMRIRSYVHKRKVVQSMDENLRIEKLAAAGLVSLVSLIPGPAR